MAINQDDVANFRAAMVDNGINVTEPIIADGVLHRYHVQGDKPKTRNAWAVLHTDGKPSGAFGCWNLLGSEAVKWTSKSAKRLSKAERHEMAAKFKAEQARRLADQKKIRDAAAVKANKIWDGAAEAGNDHPYLRRKQVASFGLHMADWHKEWINPETGEVHETNVPNALLVPIRNASREIVSLQAIFPDKDKMGRDKDFLSGGEKAGCWFGIAGDIEVGGRQVIAICEGYATGAAIHEATGIGVIVAFDAGNLKPVASAVRAKMPDAAIIIAADNDQWTTKPINNPGLTRAREAATAVGGTVAVPVFKDLQGRPTDFNDLYKEEGEKAVMEQIMPVVTKVIQGGAVSLESTGASEAAATNTPPPAFSEDALALQFADLHLDDFRHVKEQGCWYIFKDGVWQEDRTCKTLDAARSVCRHATADPAASKMSDGQIRSLASSRTASALLKLASADRRLALTAECFDCDFLALNTPMGVIDLRTGAMRPVRPSDYMTKITTVGPDPTCPRPLWDSFLKRVTADDADLVAFLQRLLGYCLTGLTCEQVLAFLYGKGANGKSVFMNTVFGVMGNYHKPAAMETFTESKSDRHPTELAALQNARVVSATETEEGRRFAEAKIKVLTGGDPIVARRMRQDFFEYTPQFKLIFAGNHKPALRSVDESIQRRFLMVPFTVTIPSEQRDKDLQEKLKAEWPAILAWMIHGCLEWQRIGLKPPLSVVAATRDYMEAEDAISFWIDDRCLRNVDGWTSSRALYRAWKEWAEDAGEFVVAEKRFVEQLVAHGFERRRYPYGRGFVGLTLANRSSRDAYNGNDGYDA